MRRRIAGAAARRACWFYSAVVAEGSLVWLEHAVRGGRAVPVSVRVNAYSSRYAARQLLQLG